LWGDRPENRVRASLSTTLWHIRRFLHRVELILSDSHTVQFDPQSDVWLDVEAFEVQVSGDETASLESAVALYRGDFVDGFTDYWIIGERFALQTLFLEALARVMVGYEARGEYQAALTRYPLS
jgi:DNA-binding SARP family transcriptional activator